MPLAWWNLLPDVLWLGGIVVNLLGTVFYVIQELLALAFDARLEAQVVLLVGIHGLSHDDAAHIPVLLTACDAP